MNGFACLRGAAWAVATTADLWRGVAGEAPGAFPTVRRWAVLVLLACGLVAAVLWHAPLLERLSLASHGPAFALPGLADALRFLVTSPAAWATLALGLWAPRWRGALRPGRARAGQETDAALVLEQRIGQGARALQAGVEMGALGGAQSGIAQGVLGIARLAHRWIEGVVLEGTTRQIADATTNGGRLAYRVMEQGGLEGLLRRTVRTVMAGSRWMQRRHTGRLRRNLIWVAASLALAALALILYVW